MVTNTNIGIALYSHKRCSDPKLQENVSWSLSSLWVSRHHLSGLEYAVHVHLLQVTHCTLFLFKVWTLLIYVFVFAATELWSFCCQNFPIILKWENWLIRVLRKNQNKSMSHIKALWKLWSILKCKGCVRVCVCLCIYHKPFLCHSDSIFQTEALLLLF